MTEEKLLEEVKKSLNITGNYQDELLKNYIVEILEYMSDAGVSDSTLKDEAIVGTVARGVNDLWVDGALSNYFYQRVTQLAYKN